MRTDRAIALSAQYLTAPGYCQACRARTVTVRFRCERVERKRQFILPAICVVLLQLFLIKSVIKSK
jgi:hypothetical protein